MRSIERFLASIFGSNQVSPKVGRMDSVIKARKTQLRNRSQCAKDGVIEVDMGAEVVGSGQFITVEGVIDPDFPPFTASMENTWGPGRVVVVLSKGKRQD